MKGIIGYGHAAIKVTDVERSLDFWRDRMGFPEMLRLNHDNGSLWLVYLRITDDQYLEIFPGAENDRAPGWNANGVNHLCFTIDDLDGTVQRIEDAGIELYSPIKAGADGNRQAWIEDPDGNRVELMEMAPGCLQLVAIERLREAEAANSA
jgi:lactoylglutathione lyase